MANKNKRRGYALEKLIVDSAKRLGLASCRAWGSNGRSLGLDPDVDGLLGGFGFQAKMKKKLPKWASIPEQCKALIYRTDREGAKAVIELHWYLELLKVWQLWWDLPTNRKPNDAANS